MKTIPYAFPPKALDLRLMKEFSGNPHDFFLKWADQTRDVSQIKMGPFQAALIKNPEMLKTILTTHHHSIRKVKKFMGILEQLDGRGLVVAEGKAWEEQRQMIMAALKREFIESYQKIILEVLDDWKPSPDKMMTPNEDMTKLTIRIIGKAMFGLDLGKEEESLGNSAKFVGEVFTKEFSSAFGPLPAWVPTPYNRKKWEHIRNIRRLAEEADRKGSSPFLRALGKADSEIRKDEIITMFMAGHDTSAAALSWCWYELGKNPEIRAQLIEEVKAVDLKTIDVATAITQLPKLTAFIYEVLRLHPPAIGMFTREFTEDVEVNGYHFPKGTWFYASTLVTGRDPQNFPDPEKFRIDRYLKDGKFVRPGDAWFPFGMGPHICIGMTLAMQEMKMILAGLLSKYRMEPAEEFNGDISLIFAMWPKHQNRWKVD